jgi:hypothetical protein
MPLHRRPSPPARRGAAVLATLGVAVAVGCNGTDPYAIRASYETTLDTLVVYPLSNPQPLLPSGVNLFTGSAVRPALVAGAYPNFDFAIDRNAQGQIVLYPAKGVAVAPAGSPKVGFALPSTTFDALSSAPRDGYRFDSLQVVTTGQTVAIESQGVTSSGLVCASATSPIRAKLIIDSVARATGALHLRMLTNPNCGFRSFASGLPKD